MSEIVAKAFIEAKEQDLKVTRYEGYIEVENKAGTVRVDTLNPTETYDFNDHELGVEVEVFGRFVNTPISSYIIKDGDNVVWDN